MNAKLDAILADLLNGQTEMADESELEGLEGRIQAYAEGAPWQPRDVELVWTSPSARRRYLQARKAVLARLADRWNDQGFGRQFLRRAADGGPSDILALEEAGVTVRILRAPGSGDWLVSVVLSPEALALLPDGVNIRLVDSGGREWLRGEPDRAGGVDAFWEDADQSPIERLREHALNLEFA